MREFLIAIGEDPDREGLLGTPDRVARACEEIFGGMQEDPSLHLLRQFHEPGNENMVIVKDIPSRRCASITCCPSRARRTSATCRATAASRASPSSRAAWWATRIARRCRSA